MKDIKDYLHLYLGCEVLWEIEHESTSEGGTEILDGHLVETAKAGLRIVKPILRPLSDIMDKEIDYAELIWQTEEKKDVGWLPYYAGSALTKYLLSKYFDLFGLIEAGLALDKTKLK